MVNFLTAALEYMQGQHISGRVFNEDWFGGYMEWEAPDIKPFIDSRADIFVYNGTFDDYVRAVRIVRPFEVLDKYHIDYALLEPDQPLVYVLLRSGNWRVLFSDNVAVLLSRVPAHGDSNPHRHFWLADAQDTGPPTDSGLTELAGKPRSIVFWRGYKRSR